jgi:hypothetical protein
MSSLTFFARTMVLTFVAVLLLQVRWGTTTLEDHTMNFLTSSALVKPIDQTASGMVIFIRNTWNRVTKSINTNFTNALRRENQPGSRFEGFTIQRSQEYIQQNAREASRAAGEAAQEYAPEMNQAKQTTLSAFEKFKRQAQATSRKVKSKFIDETDTPGKSAEGSAASSTHDDDIIEE